MKINKILILIIAFFFLITIPSFAQDEDEETNSEEVKEKIKERLEKTATDSAEADEEEDEDEDEDKPKEEYFAWVGTLMEVDDDILFIDTVEGEKEAEVDKKTTILQSEKGKSRKEVDVEDLEEGNFVIAMGTLDDEDKIDALRVLSSPPEEEEEERGIVFGKVSEIEEEKITLNNGEETNLPIDEDDTKLTIKGVSKSKFVDIQIEDKLYAVVILDDDGDVDETISIYVIPGKYSPENENNKLDEEDEATPSAKEEEEPAETEDE